MDIYQQLIVQIKSANPSAELTIGDICALDQDLAYLHEVPGLLVNPRAGLNLVAASQRVFTIASRWLGSDRLMHWMQAYIKVNNGV